MLLTERIGGPSLPDLPELANTLSRLDMSRTDVGKVKLAFTLGLISERDRRLLRFLSELRNTFVHNIQNVRLTLQDHVASFNQDQRNSFADTLFVDRTDHLTRIVLSYPRRSIWLTSLMLLTHLRTQFELLQVTRRAPGTSRDDFTRELTELTTDMDSLLHRIKGPPAATEGQPQS